MPHLKSVFASAAFVWVVSLGGSAVAGPQPVTPVVSVPAVSVIIAPNSDIAGVGLPTFFTVTRVDIGGGRTLRFTIRATNF
jgi:hypothetical protein